VLQIQALRTKSTENLNNDLVTKFGLHPWYLPSEIQEVETNGAKIPKISPSNDTQQFGPKPGWRFASSPNPLFNFKVRQSWTDVLLQEDPSASTDTQKKVGDLVGATFSWAHDYSLATDSWNAVGAILFPVRWTTNQPSSYLPGSLAFVPSVSIDRLSGTSSTHAIDELYYRLGLFGEWQFEPDNVYTAVDVRASPVYGTNLSHQAQLPAYEIELEPNILWKKGPNKTMSFANSLLNLGYQNNLIPPGPKKGPELDLC
jgi:hypothetical protein